MVAAPPVAVRALRCPSCGAAIEQRGFDHTRSVACASCFAVLDAADPSLRVLTRFAGHLRVRPQIPLGTRGQVGGAPYEAIGFMQRSIAVDGERYAWREYLLFNPYRGFLYLTEYDGHWNLVRTVRALPERVQQGGRLAARYGGDTFRHFQTAVAGTDFVLGEFPWEVRAEDRAEVRDFIAPPRVLSAESTDDETAWSLGEYVTGACVWKTFELPGRPPAPRGVYANQPSPFAAARRSVWQVFMLFLIALVAMAAVRYADAPAQVLRESRQLAPGQLDPYVTESFTLGGRTSNLEVRVGSDVSNSWFYLVFALVDEGSGRAVDFAREVSYYEGVEGGERWTEGSRTDRVRIPSVPPGRYYLRVAPELAPDAVRPVSYTLTLRRDVPSGGFYAVALLLLLVPPVWVTARAAAFESTRWMESDYGSATGNAAASDGEDDD